ncbi:NAD(P)/FAD-dependent oxidoreductase [Tumebacillus sp. DT12]|uniref:NAD(P)/FAD-dependent oxidoreductase n=1 Tax=Tumebacillus lacus TaxID=2995335 RepID=A0ABT3X4F7_9BACL|nr:NAD(P)/FAD-dependent oxidoreductase [Tumebacillus lacus]MCX7571783.1 NAD(P)/FAD-dependent oxidoreductase [Tumebacillus lacus]
MRELDADVIVIGSGIGGLSFGGSIANKGYKVLVFEASHVPGGYCQSFGRKGYRFITSVHKIGGHIPKEIINRYMRTVGDEEPIDWYDFDEYLRVGPEFRVNSGSHDLEQILIEAFPHEKANIVRFFTDMDVFLSEFLYLQRYKNNFSNFNPRHIRNFMKFTRITMEQMLDLYFEDPNLRACVYALADGRPGHFALEMVVTLKFGEGPVSVPVGGVEVLLERFLKIIEKNGGRLLMRSPVEKILVEEGRAVGVEVNGQTYYSRYVVSNADIRTTYADLIGEEHLPAPFLNKLLKKWRPSSSCFGIWLGLDSPIETFGWSGENVNYFRSFDRLFELKADLIKNGGTLPSDTGCFIGTSASKDPLLTPAGMSQVTIGVPIASDYENGWGVDENGKRGKRYRETKQRVADRLLDVAEDLLPGLRDHVSVMEIGTPLTYERYSRNRGGAYLGFSVVPDFSMDKDRPESLGKLPGLFISSNWSTTGGGVINIMMEAMKGVDTLLRMDGRDDFYEFDEQQVLPKLESAMKVAVPQ